ncbi:hypothetical protein Tco_0433185 [Tanacetum coccineum]
MHEAQQEIYSSRRRGSDDPDLVYWLRSMCFGSSSEKERKEEGDDVMTCKGKAVVTEEQVAHSLIDLSKKKRTIDQFILVRRDQTPHDSTTGPSSQPDDDTSEKSMIMEKSKVNVGMSDSTIPDPSHQTSNVTSNSDASLLRYSGMTHEIIEKYSVLPGPESVKNQESERVEKQIYQKPKGTRWEKQISTYSIRSTNKVDLEEFNLKSKDHKRKHDSDDDEDDDDDEGPSAGSNQGRSTKRRRSDSAASRSAQPPPKDDDQSSKKPRESDASASKQHPALTSTG